MIFHKFTKHRGAFHSLIAAVAFAFFSTAISFNFYDKSAFVSWLIGLFVFYGFIIHLALDELYSVDFMNYRIKRSFGTAMKIVDTKQWASSGIIFGIAMGSYSLSPSPTVFINTFLSAETYQIIWDRMLPSSLNSMLQLAT
jgi:hypothetical protein